MVAPMEPLGTDGRASASVRLLAVVALAIGTTGVVAATHHTRSSTSLQTAPATEASRRPVPGARGSTTAGSSVLASDATTTSVLATTTTAAPPETTTTSTTPESNTTVVTLAPTTTQPSATCGPPPPASSATPPAGKVLYWIQNTASIAVTISTDDDSPRPVDACKTVGPFSATPQHDEPTAGDDWAGVSTGGPCAYVNEGFFYHAGNSYVLKLIELPPPNGCPNPNTPVVRVHVFDMATGEQIDTYP